MVFDAGLAGALHRMGPGSVPIGVGDADRPVGGDRGSRGAQEAGERRGAAAAALHVHRDGDRGAGEPGARRGLQAVRAVLMRIGRALTACVSHMTSTAKADGRVT